MPPQRQVMLLFDDTGMDDQHVEPVSNMLLMGNVNPMFNSYQMLPIQPPMQDL
jgi:hypothetical protein